MIYCDIILEHIINQQGNRLQHQRPTKLPGHPHSPGRISKTKCCCPASKPSSVSDPEGFTQKKNSSKMDVHPNIEVKASQLIPLYLGRAMNSKKNRYISSKKNITIDHNRDVTSGISTLDFSFIKSLVL